MIFKFADIDNILYKDKYKMSKNGTKSVTYEALDDKLRTRKMVIFYEPYFENVIKYEENPKNKKYYEKIAQFYGNLKGIDK